MFVCVCEIERESENRWFDDLKQGWKHLSLHSVMATVIKVEHAKNRGELNRANCLTPPPPLLLKRALYSGGGGWLRSVLA